MIFQDKLHSFIIQDDRNTRFPSTTNYKNNIIKRFYRENSPLDGAVQSGQSAIYVVCRVIKGFWAKTFEKIYFNSAYKITRPTSRFWILPSAKIYNASCRVFKWTLVMKKRSQNHFRLHFTSKIPYSFDTRSILTTPACGVHGRKKTVNNWQSDHVRKRSWQTIRTRNIIQRNI